MHAGHLALWTNPSHGTMVMTQDQQQLGRPGQDRCEVPRKWTCVPPSLQLCVSSHTGEELSTILSGFLVLFCL